LVRLLTERARRLDEVYSRLAIVLTDLENHRTQSEYEDALVVKTFLFQFVNSYFTLFYIAFFKSKYPVCIWRFCRLDYCTNGDCFRELMLQLLVIFGVKQLVLQLVEVATPYVACLSPLLCSWLTFIVCSLVRYMINKIIDSRRVKQLQQQGKKPPPSRSLAEAEGNKPIYGSTFEDYNEMVIQFGYVILFVSAFPLAPLFALINNLVEIRTDAFKLLRLHQRPALGRAEDIGTWYGILEALSVIGVVTNCFILGFTSSSFASVNGLSITQRIWFAFIAEHALLVIKTLLAAVIPDRPGDVMKELAKKQWIRDVQLEAIEQQEAGGGIGAAAARSFRGSMAPDVDLDLEQLPQDELEKEDS
jgi:anoctamin-10/anoctamin-7